MLLSPTISFDLLAGHLAALDAASVTALVERAVAEGTPTGSIGTELLDAWQCIDREADGGDAAGTAAAAAVARRALARATLVAERPAPEAGRAPILVLTSSSSADLLGAEVIAERVGDAGWPADVLSASGGDGLDAHLRAHRPAAVVLALGEVTDLPRASRMVAVAHAEGVPVLTWGAAFGPDDLRSGRIGADGWSADVGSLSDVVERWALHAPRLAPPVEVPCAFEQLEAERPALLSATVNIGGVEETSSDWAQRTARTVVTHLAAAVLVGDSRILADRLETERRNLRRKDLLEVHLLGLVDALAGALPDGTLPAQQYVMESREHLRRSLLSSRPPKQAEAEAPPGRRPLRSLLVGNDAPPSTTHPAPAPARPGAAQVGEPAPSSGAGQVFADILLLAALACQTPMALVSVPQGNGQWSTLSYGFEQRDGLNDPTLFDYVSARNEPVDISDLSVVPALSPSPLAQAPHKLRWVYAVALRNSSGTVLGVVAVADRWLRDLSRRDQRALLAVARQMGTHLSSLRRVPTTPATPPAGGDWTPPSTSTAGAPAPQPLAGIVGLRRGAGLPEGQQLLRSHEVAVLFDVTERTVINWAAAGKLASLRTIGGHLRFRSEDVLELLAGRTTRAAR